MKHLFSKLQIQPSCQFITLLLSMPQLQIQIINLLSSILNPSYQNLPKSQHQSHSGLHGSLAQVKSKILLMCALPSMQKSLSFS